MFECCTASNKGTNFLCQLSLDDHITQFELLPDISSPRIQRSFSKLELVFSVQLGSLDFLGTVKVQLLVSYPLESYYRESNSLSLFSIRPFMSRKLTILFLTSQFRRKCHQFKHIDEAQFYLLPFAP
jgi:hypothetical protein